MSQDKIRLPMAADADAPVLQFQYLYNYQFPTVAAAFLNKYTYEPRTQLTTFSGVTQLDDDRVMFYRRVESVHASHPTYERVTYNRADKTITNEVVLPEPGNNERLFERGVFQATEEGDQTVQNHFIIDHQSSKTLKIDLFKIGVEKVIKAIKFAQFEQSQ